MFDSDDEHYEVQLARRHTEAETLLHQQEEKEYLEHQAHKEAKIAEWKKLEKEVQKKKRKSCGGEKKSAREIWLIVSRQIASPPWNNNGTKIG